MANIPRSHTLRCETKPTSKLFRSGPASSPIRGIGSWSLISTFPGARAVGLEEVEYLAYAQTGGIVELSLPKHKYNPLWINPITGEELPLKDYKGETFSRQTPDNAHDWILQVPREGHKESMLRSYRFESVDPPVQEIETDPSKLPFQIVDPAGDEINPQSSSTVRDEIGPE